MRIEKVVIENINSLAGRFEVDFTDGRYSEGLFAIVGASGAGKSTVLDAICLALYGKTPRIGVISESNDEIMNKHGDMCSSEVTFWSRNKRYKSIFMHHRAKGKNPFRQVKREIVEYDVNGSGSVIASMIKEVNLKIVEITGLDYSQFTRSIMLAQFQFAEFLKADSNARADILEQISDMSIYRKISAAVYERTKREKGLLDNLHARIDAVDILEDDQVAQLKEEMQQLVEHIELFDALRSKFILCRDTTQMIKGKKQLLTDFENKKAQAAGNLKKQQSIFSAAKSEVISKEKSQSRLLQTLKTVRDMDKSIETANTEVVRLKNDIRTHESKIKENKKTILELFKKYMPNADRVKLKEAYESEAAADILRREAMTDLEAEKTKEEYLKQTMNAILQGKDVVFWQNRKDLLEIVLPLIESQKAIVQAELQKSELKTKLKTLRSNQETHQKQEKEIEEKFLFVKLMKKFGEERRKLEEGKPCPLCGATHHPIANQQDDILNINEVVKQRDMLLEQSEQIKGEIITVKHDIGVQEKIIGEMNDIVSKCKVTLKDRSWSFEDVGIDVIDNNAPEKVREEIGQVNNILRQYTDQARQRDSINSAIIKLTQQLGEVDVDVANINHCKQTIGEYENHMREEMDVLTRRVNSYSNLASERKILFGDKETDIEESKAKQLYDKVRQALEKARGELEDAKTKMTKVQSNIDRTKAEVVQYQGDLNTVYENVLRDSTQMHVLFSKDEYYKNPFSQELSRLIDNLDQDAYVSEDTIVKVPEKLGLLVSMQTERKGELKNRLDMDAQNKKTLGDMRRNVKKQEKVCDKWNRLNALIGSSDGIKFSRMAQGITFEVLLKYANNNLKKMSDRYILVRDERNPSKPLEISVVDNYQAGDIRPVSNLSGGESFVVSMALALGLSEMSSNKTRIDSLFIDEGFASLDDEYLESALQTLSSLGNRESKLVGVISHVGALKERIDTQIEVQKLSGGKSTLVGPGVTVA